MGCYPIFNWVACMSITIGKLSHFALCLEQHPKRFGICCYWWVFWCLFQNNIPVFSPALTDGAIGDMFYLFSAENPGLKLDIIDGKRVFISAYLFGFVVSACHKDAFDFRCYKVEHPRSVCQLHRDDHPGRRCSQTSLMQCKFMGRFFVFYTFY